MLPATMSIDDLTRRCAEETDKFNQKLVTEAAFCFELLRRALAESVSEAFTRVYQIYEPLVRRWVYSNSAFTEIDEDADYFISTALANFYLALRGVRFNNFQSLPEILAYLKACVHSAIAQYRRDQQYRQVSALDETNDPGYTQDFNSTVSSNLIWDHICQVITDERDQRLANCLFVQNLKPVQIVREFPDDWESERQVSVARQRVCRKLRQDTQLRAWLLDAHL